ncbi:MAG: 50S ribosomal protein L13 [Chloroflexi bacterium HGW-Chloroflexi-10]|nr:MAG: 50S ribosomal protein L13 [Chloroflexi bacterium HGW-Chloroflexi-10]
MEKTYVIKGTPESNWLLVDAKNQRIGRLATQIASYLLGKHKPTFTPGVDMGDFVVVINVDDLEIDQKRLDTKLYHRHSGYPGGLTTVKLGRQMEIHPDRVIRSAVWGMLPHTKQGRRLMKRLRIYSGSEHPHEAQKPQALA